MRGARWLLLVAMAAIVGGVSLTYRAQKKVLHDQSPAKPEALPPELNSAARQWNWTETDEKGCKTAFITADDFKQVKDSSRVDLKNVSLKIFKPCKDIYNLVKSAAATFYAADHRLYSENEVEITLAVPTEGEPPANLVSIHSSGVTFDSNGGRAETDRPSTFTFRFGDGRATGASYDPSTRELHMKSNVEVHFHPAGVNARPMTVEAADLTYYEARSEIDMPQWGRLTRGATMVEGYGSVVHLDDGVIRQVTTTRAQGTDEYPNRKLQYSADTLAMVLDEDGQVTQMVGRGNAHLQATSTASETTVAAPSVELDFVPDNGESQLTRVVTTGAGTVTAMPLPVPGRQLSETHILRSDNIEMKMRPGGKDVETLVTHGPGHIEFLPNLPAQHHRTLDGKDMVIAYGAENRIESFRATGVKTVTDPNEEERRRNRQQTQTASRDLTARFEAGGSRLESMQQSGDFTYREGDRQARAAKATLDSANNVMLLETGARMWDSTGSTTADRIRVDERTGNFTAEGNVKSSRLADQNPKNRNGMLSGDEPLEAQADKMDSTNRNRTLHYQGHASLWQGANRLQADVVEVDREKQTLTADGNVVSNLWEEPKEQAGKKAGPPTQVVVHAAHLLYTDKDRLAAYSGGVVLDRPGMQVRAGTVQAYLADSSAESRLQKAYANGSVEIVQRGPAVSRTGAAEHAEYYPDQQKLILNGGHPQIVDKIKGDEAHGTELTYFANDDRLLVNGSPSQPATSRIRRK